MPFITNLSKKTHVFRCIVSNFYGIKLISKLMKTLKFYLIAIAATALLFSCSKEDGDGTPLGECGVNKNGSGSYSDDASGTESGSDSSGSTDSGSGSSDNGSGNNQSGLITAGEWNDLDNWDFWNDLISKEGYKEKTEYWGYNTDNRISVNVMRNGNPICNAKLELIKKDGSVVWTTQSDNRGMAELWIGIQESDFQADINQYYLKVNGSDTNIDIKLYDNGVNNVITSEQNSVNKIEIAFVVDATGSMGDEIAFLKDDLKNVINNIKEQSNNGYDIYTSGVFYRDEGDEYVVRKSDFSSDLETTIGFINDQGANGGGDFPEAVHTGLKTAIQELNWTNNARTKIAFLLLDAPPHYEAQIVDEIHKQVKEASTKGIKIIPITASGIDKETEFLMRYMAIATNGTYVFITNDSGIGNDHIEASVGNYEVEYLNELMVRLVKKYIE